MRKAACFLALLLVSSTPSIAQNGPASRADDLFPRPEQLDDAVAFWTRVYTEVDTNGGFIHDNLHMDVVYEVVRFPEGATQRQRRRLSGDALDRYRTILNRLAAGGTGSLTTDEARVRALWPAGTKRGEFRAAAERLRFQLGQADRYRAGLIRSGRWKPYIIEVLDAQGLPRELAALPHVESSFDPTAYSKVGAAGMWQFTRSTGLRYMQIDHIIDQRRDPFMATDAAARLLADNFSVIGTWPLALTAYNHGLGGMRRAVDQVGTTDIGAIVERYQSRSFGFASRNFYAAFLAALDVDREPQKYFGELRIDAPERHLVVELPDYVDAAPLASALGVSRSELERLNPALMDTVWAGEKFVPRGFPVRLPAAAGSSADALLARIPAGERFAEQRPDLQHRVRRGETLSGIADRYRVSLAALVRANGLSNRNFIREGQLLNLPAAGAAQAVPITASVSASVSASVTAAAASSGEYVVRSGDSIDRIARRLGVDQATLLATNNIENRNRIYPGQVLRVPGADGSYTEPVGAAAVSAATATLAALVPPAATRDAAQTPTAAAPDPAIADDFTAAEGVTDASAGAVAEPDSALLADARNDVVIDPDAPALAADDVSAVVAAAGLEPDSDLDSNVLASTQATLAGDPSDYSVAADQTIEVQALETLGHYADWLGIRTQRLRDINGMEFGEAVVYGQRVRLDLSAADTATFEARRQAFHEQHQESFFSAHQIAAIVEHVVRPGESLWLLALRTYDVPVWLLRQYNPDLDLDRVQPGTIVKFPRFRSIDTPDARDIG